MKCIQIYFWNLLWASEEPAVLTRGASSAVFWFWGWPVVKGANDVQWHPAVTVPIQVVGELGGGKEKQICEGLRGWMLCCEGSRMVLVWQSNKGRVWAWKMWSLKDGRKYILANKTRCADKLWRTLNMGISWYESIESVQETSGWWLHWLTFQVIFLIIFWLGFQYARGKTSHRKRELYSSI